jgi:3-hydroxyisobutyrate dehydrogenase-like beta-hydroxyacid dehydrogenase
VRVGFIGCGDIGGPMADRLLQSGHTVTVYDPVPAATERRAGLGAKVAASAADAAVDADVACVVVRDDSQAITAVTGADGVLAGAGPDAIVLLHSTVAPATVRHLAGSCAGKGVRFADVGISGGAARAADGTLYLMCGGDQSTLDAARPVLESLGTHITRFGPVGSGMAAKLARNLVHYGVMVAVHEGQRLAEESGLDLGAFADLLANTPTAAMIPFVSGRVTSHPPVPGFDQDFMSTMARLGRKDLDDAIALAAELGVETPMALAVRRQLSGAFGVPSDPAEPKD